MIKDDVRYVLKTVIVTFRYMARGNGGTRVYRVLCTITYEAIINKYLDQSPFPLPPTTREEVGREREKRKNKKTAPENPESL